MYTNSLNRNGLGFSSYPRSSRVMTFNPLSYKYSFSSSNNADGVAIWSSSSVVISWYPIIGIQLLE